VWLAPDREKAARFPTQSGRLGAHGAYVADGVATGRTKEATDDATMQTALPQKDN
jgi:hypothetical protein